MKLKYSATILAALAIGASAKAGEPINGQLDGYDLQAITYLIERGHISFDEATGSLEFNKPFSEILRLEGGLIDAFVAKDSPVDSVERCGITSCRAK